MSDKTFVFDQIKKLMSWCPNAKPAEIRSWISPANKHMIDQEEVDQEEKRPQ